MVQEGGEISSSSSRLFAVLLKHVETQALRIKQEPVLSATVLHDLRNVPRVLQLLQLDVRAVPLDRVSDQLRGACLTLRPDNHGLLLLAGLIDNECRTLSLLLCYLLGLDGCRELGGKSKVLQLVLARLRSIVAN